MTRSLFLQIDILYKKVPLPDHYTLIDIAYIYSWKRVSTVFYCNRQNKKLFKIIKFHSFQTPPMYYMFFFQHARFHSIKQHWKHVASKFFCLVNSRFNFLYAVIFPLLGDMFKIIFSCVFLVFNVNPFSVNSTSRFSGTNTVSSEND